MKSKLSYLFFLLCLIAFAGCENERFQYSSITDLRVKIAENTSLEYGIDIDSKGYDYCKSGTHNPPVNAEQSLLFYIKGITDRFVYIYEPKEGFIGTDMLEFYYTLENKDGTKKTSPALIRLFVEVEKEDIHDYVTDISVVIDQQENYTYFLGINYFPKEFEIVSFPSCASFCDIIDREDLTGIYFCYTPEKGFKGKDYIEVLSYELDKEINANFSEKKIHKKYCFTIEVE